MSEHAEAIADQVAKALYVEAHWSETITEHDSDRKPDAEYKRRAGQWWEQGLAGWSRYQTYSRLANAAREALAPRVVTTLEELKTVYEGAILKDAEGEMWGIDGATGRLFLVGDGNYDLYDDSELHLPATVVYEEPEAAA